MISENLQKAMNEQVALEMWSANVYLSMSFHFEKEGYAGFANWMRKQFQEEMEHAMSIADYIMKRGGTAIVSPIPAVENNWGSPLEVFEKVFEHEVMVSKAIDKLVDVASADKDKASQDFLWGFVREQVEEEATAQSVVDQVRRAGEAGLFFVDAKMGERQ